MQELQRTLSELEREEREMAAQRMSGRTIGQQHKAASSQNISSNFQTDGAKASISQHHQQVFKSVFPALKLDFFTRMYLFS